MVGNDAKQGGRLLRKGTKDPRPTILGLAVPSKRSAMQRRLGELK